MKRLKFVYHDGGRADAGYKGSAGDCVVRAIAIATERPYQEVYDALKLLAQRERPRGKKTRSSVRDGTEMSTIRRYMNSIGWVWVPTMTIGSGCKVHLCAGEVPATGRIVARLSRHLTALVDGVVYDTHDPQRDEQYVYGSPAVRDPKDGQMRNPIVATMGGRCVYGYWRQA